MSNALSITRDIVVAALGSMTSFSVANELYWESTANLIQTVYDKVKEIEDQEG